MRIFKTKFIKEMKEKYNIDIVVDSNYSSVYYVYYPISKGSTEFQEKRIAGFDSVEKFCNEIKKAYE